jgi:DNA-binding response OmpR family regulator
MIVEAHGGRIWVNSPPSSLDQSTGAEFIFTLPLLPKFPPTETPTDHHILKPIQIKQPDWKASGEKILVVEDETDVQTLLHTVLSQEGYEVEIASDGPTALDLIQIDPPHLILLDWVIPGMRGVQVCQNIRRWSNIPIIMVTSKTSQDDLITALDAGADDYVTKPFQTSELLARIRTLIRRGDFAEIDSDAGQFSADGLVIDFTAQSAWLFDKPVELTPTEYNILVFLARHRGQVITYNQLMDEIGEPAEKRNRHRLFVHISRLREKIETNPKDPHFIQTKWGIGYVFLPKEQPD